MIQPLAGCVFGLENRQFLTTLKLEVHSCSLWLFTSQSQAAGAFCFIWIRWDFREVRSGAVKLKILVSLGSHAFGACSVTGIATNRFKYCNFIKGLVLLFIFFIPTKLEPFGFA